MGVITKYKFNPATYENYLPEFNGGFTGYTTSDVTNDDGTITRTISHDTLKPTYIIFGSSGTNETDRAKSILEVIECDTSNVTNMRRMFNYCSALTSLDLSGFNTSKVTDMRYMFYGCSSLTSLDLSSCNTSKVTDMIGMFQNCSALTSVKVHNFYTSKVTDMSNMFNGCSKLTTLNLINWGTSNVTNMSYMFSGCSSLTTLNLSYWNTSSVTNMNNMFYGCNRLTSLDISNFNTSKVSNMSYMFRNCSSLTSLDLSNFDTSKVTNMGYMFWNCNKLTSLDLSNFNTSNVNTMYEMFYNCNKLISLDLSNFNTSNVNTMYEMFYNCNKLTSLDLSNFNTSKVTDMRSMFENCSSLTSLDLSNFNTSNVNIMVSMFANCSSLTSLGMIYSDSATINKITEALGTSASRNIYYLDANPDELNAQSRVTYVKYRESKANTNDVVLRKLGDVADTLDLVTGKLTQRINEIVLDGSDDENWIINGSINNSMMYYLTLDDSLKSHSDPICLCDKRKCYPPDKGNEAMVKNGLVVENNIIYISVLRTEITESGATSVGIDGFKHYLASNPITVQYVLETPIISTVDINIVDQDNQPQNALHSLPNGNINVESQGLLPSIDYTVPTNNTYYFSPVTKPSTSYIFKTPNGYGTFTTPSTLKEMIIFPGDAPSAIMFEDNNYSNGRINSIPYFDGMKSVVNPEVTLRNSPIQFGKGGRK